jgi:hypothetical protein
VLVLVVLAVLGLSTLCCRTQSLPCVATSPLLVGFATAFVIDTVSVIDFVEAPLSLVVGVLVQLEGLISMTTSQSTDCAIIAVLAFTLLCSIFSISKRSFCIVGVGTAIFVLDGRPRTLIRLFAFVRDLLFSRNDLAK